MGINLIEADEVEAEARSRRTPRRKRAGGLLRSTGTAVAKSTTT